MAKRIRLGILVALSIGMLAAPTAVGAQPPAKVPRTGIICATQCGFMSFGLQQAMREFGYIDGQNINIDLRGAGVSDDQLPRLAADLVARKVDILVAAGTSAAVWATKKATRTIPIVMVVSDEAVESGLIDSLSRPGGNITGLTVPYTDLHAKQLELLKEAAPRVSRVAVMWNPANRAHGSALERIQTPARSMGVELVSLEVRGPVVELETAFSAAARQRAGALLVLPDPMLTRTGQLTLLALQRQLPAISTFREFVSAAGLIAYGPSLPEMVRRAAFYVDKILKGTKPADLPVEQPSRYQLVLSLTTARALGLTIPQPILIRADEVIQ